MRTPYFKKVLIKYLLIALLLLTNSVWAAEPSSVVNTANPVSNTNVMNLPGVWKVIGCQLNTRWLPESIFKEFRYTITADNRYSIDWSDLSYPQFQGGFPKSKTGRIVLNTTVTPNTIDLIPDEGPYKGQIFKGIFDLYQLSKLMC